MSLTMATLYKYSKIDTLHTSRIWAMVAHLPMMVMKDKNRMTAMLDLNIWQSKQRIKNDCIVHNIKITKKKIQR